MFYKATALSFLMLSNMVHAEACSNIPADLTEPNYGVVQWLGGGYDLDRERITVNSCLNGEKVFETGGANASLYVSFLTDYERISTEVNRSKGGKIKIGWFSFGKSRSFTERITKTKYSQSFVLAFDIVTGNSRFNINSNDPLNNLADRVKKDACEFKKYCGDSYVFQTEEGAKLALGIQISFDSEDAYNQYTKESSFGVEGSINKTFNICTNCGSIPLPINVSFNGEFKKSLQSINSNLKQKAKIEVFAIQQGGDVAQLGKALGTNNALASCSLNNVDACVQMADNALTYIRSSEFVDGVKNMPGVLNYAHRAYHEVDPDAPRSQSEITPAIETARQQLATEFDNRQADLEKLQSTLMLALSPARQQTLAQLKQSLETDIQTLYQTGLLCFSDLVNCPQKAAQVLAGLKSYDRTFLNPNRNDGLVAYYPFDGNAFDESGNGNDGTVYGATLTTDRNGKAKSAYSFNGLSAIEISPNNLFNDQVTISTWVNWAGSCPNSTGECLIFNKEGVVEMAVRGYSDLQFAIQTKTSVWAWYSSGITISPNDWKHIVLAFDKNSLATVYVDGKFVKTLQYSGGLASNENIFKIAARSSIKGSAVTPFNGKIDDFRIYNRVLSAEEIKQLYETTDSKANQIPFASFKGNLVDKTITVDASSSNVPNGTIQRYEWLSSDGQMKSGKTATFIFEKAGDYTITLTAIDDKGATSQAVKNISIQNIGEPPLTCTNKTITSCRASFSFETGDLCIPCVSVPTVLGSQIYAAELKQTAPLKLSFQVNPLTLKPHNFKDSCLATYTGILNVPCVQVGTTSYDVDFTQRSNSLIFDVYDVR